MALVTCKECGKEVSDNAYDCPSCGAALKKVKRGFMGQIFKWSFILFNVLMLVWMISGMSGGADAVNSAKDSASQAGAAIGTGIGALMLAAIWGFGDFVLGLFVLFTRPKKK